MLKLKGVVPPYGTGAVAVRPILELRPMPDGDHPLFGASTRESGLWCQPQSQQRLRYKKLPCAIIIAVCARRSSHSCLWGW